MSFYPEFIKILLGLVSSLYQETWPLALDQSSIDNCLTGELPILI